MFCENCGKEIVNGAKICGYCGAGIRQFTNQQDRNQTSYAGGQGYGTGPYYQQNVNQQPYGGQGYGMQPYYQQMPQQGSKSKVAAGLLGIFLGGLGIHNFYLGYTGKAVAQLLITLVSVGFLAPVSGFWGFIEGIMILCGTIKTDGKGFLLK